jgi:hypothetical protein
MNDSIDPRLDTDDPPVPPGLTVLAGDAIFHAFDLLKLVLVRFWTPLQLAALPFIQQSRKLELLDWLRPVELMLRRMIFLEARALAATLPPPPAPRAARSGRERQPHRPFDRDRPETWRCTFRALPLKANSAPSRYRPYDPVKPRERLRAHDTRPLAIRLEAAIRVIINPMPLIKRLAAHLRRKSIPAPHDLAAAPRCRIPTALRTLNPLAREIGIPPQIYDDS